MPIKRTVPTYAANGKRLRDHSEPHVLTLEKRGVVVLTRRGSRIKVCQFKDGLGANPVRKTAHLGTAYSFYSRIGDSAQLWQHKSLPRIEAAYLLAIFRAVPLSVLARGPAPNTVNDNGSLTDPRPNKHDRPTDPRRARKAV